MGAPVSGRGQKRNRADAKKGTQAIMPASPQNILSCRSARARSQQAGTAPFPAKAIHRLAAVSRNCGGHETLGLSLTLTLSLRRHGRGATLPLGQQDASAAQPFGASEKGVIRTGRRGNHCSQRRICVPHRLTRGRCNHRRKGGAGHRRCDRGGLGKHSGRLDRIDRTTTTRQSRAAKTQQQQRRTAHRPKQRIIRALHHLIHRRRIDGPWCGFGRRRRRCHPLRDDRLCRRNRRGRNLCGGDRNGHGGNRRDRAFDGAGAGRRTFGRLGRGLSLRCRHRRCAPLLHRRRLLHDRLAGGIGRYDRRGGRWGRNRRNRRRNQRRRGHLGQHRGCTQSLS